MVLLQLLYAISKLRFISFNTKDLPLKSQLGSEARGGGGGGGGGLQIASR